MRGPCRICVFCGSSNGNGERYVQIARELGQALLERKCGLVFGGSRVGLMGVLADTVLAGGGEVIGVIPEALVLREVAHPDVSTLHVVAGMHPRKARMAELATAFVALPGGYGTLDELFETITWRQLGFHHKPIGLLNSNGYFDGLVDFINHAVQERFIKPEYGNIVHVGKSPLELIDRLLSK